jgi:SAM-dependent methyltransferase
MNPVSKNFNPKVTHPLFLMRRELFSAIRKHAHLLNGNLLDFGCGSKPYKSLFSVESYTGLDFEVTGHDHTNEEIDVFYDGKVIPFPDEQFDCVLCSEVVEHLFDLPAVVAEIHRVLKPGGKLLLTCPFVWIEHEVPYDYARYTQYALRHMLEQGGFRVIRDEKRGLFIEALTQLRVLYFSQVFEPCLVKFGLIGKIVARIIVAAMNLWGVAKSRLLPAKSNFYLSNAILSERVIN